MRFIPSIHIPFLENIHKKTTDHLNQHKNKTKFNQPPP